MFAPNFRLNNSRSSAAMHDDHLLHVGAIHEPLGRVQPHGPPAERRERLLVRLVVKAAALPGGRQDDGEGGHAVEDTGCGMQGTGTAAYRERHYQPLQRAIKLLFDNRQDSCGDVFLRASDRGEHFARRRDHFDFVVGRADRLRAVGDHQVAELLLELGQRAQAVVFGFEREADDPAAALFRAERGDDVVGFDEVQIDRLAGLGDLVRFDAHRPIVARGGGADQAVADFEFLRRRRRASLRWKRPARRAACAG